METLINECMKMGFGLMRLPRLKETKNEKIDIEQTKQMVDEFIQAGGKYFDTAFIYPGSEAAIKLALCDRYPRDTYYLASKLNAGEFTCKSEVEAKNEINISLQRTGAGYFDFYLLHALDEGNKGRYDSFGLWDFVKQLKAEGKIKHYGFSFHDRPELLDQLLNDHPDVEFVQLQINYADWEEAAIQSRACYEVAVKHCKPVVVMEPVKGGMLANPPEQVQQVFKQANAQASMASWAIRFVASLPGVMVVLSGMSTIEQMRDNVSYMEHFKPLTSAEQQTIELARETLSKIDRIACTGCHYCTPGCPVEMHIPEIFSVMNVYKMYGKLKQARMDYVWRPGGPKASACLQCGQCEDACPQHLPIISYLQEVVEKLEK